MKKLFLFVLLISAISCQKEEFLDTAQQKDVTIETRSDYICDGLDYVTIGLEVNGTVEEACQLGICAALYDLSAYYTVEIQQSITAVEDEFFNLEPNEGPVKLRPKKQVLTSGVNSTEVLVLTDESIANLNSYLSTLRANIVNDPENAQYWINFIECYEDQLPTSVLDKQPFTGG